MAEPTTTEDPQGNWQEWAVDRAFRGMIRTALALPWERRVAMMGWLMRRVVAPRAGWRNRALANMAYIWPDMPLSERETLADRVAENVGRTIVENYDVPGMLRRMGNEPLQGDGVAALEQARAEGRPVLFVTGHFGNHEAPRAALVARGYQIGGLYRPMSNPYFNAHYAANMHNLSGPVFEQGRRGTTGLVRHVRQGGMAALLFDVYDSHGTPIDFLGKPAPTLTSAAEIANRGDALMIPYFGRRRADGLGLDAVIEAPIPKDDPVEMMREATRRLEARIAEDPEQWFWFHRRWKPKRQRRRAAAKMGPNPSP